MTQAKPGDTVRIHYTGTLDDGTMFDSSAGREPLEFVLGAGQIIVGLDKAIEGMAAGEKGTVNIPSAEAYGSHDPSQRQAVPRGAIPDHIPLELGLQLQMQSEQGQALVVSVVALDDENVTLDANHPLAGKDLTFEFEIVEIKVA